ncbi:hypothetical protein JMJ77_0014024, partial [Colletotrichum scovillei]
METFTSLSDTSTSKTLVDHSSLELRNWACRSDLHGFSLSMFQCRLCIHCIPNFCLGPGIRRTRWQ